MTLPDPKPHADVRIFGVGAAKTGTHTLGGMFGGLSVAHEADAGRLIDLHLDREQSGRDFELHSFLQERDQRRQLKVDASQVNLYLIEDLEELFPDSRYILTVRHPIDWLRSIIDDSLRRPHPHDVWARFRDYRFRRPGPRPAQENVLERRGLYSVEGYLGYWRDAIDRVMDTVPKERLLVVKTTELSMRMADIAQFCGVRPAQVLPDVRLFANPSRSGVLGRLDPQYLATVAKRVCGPRAELFFERSITAAVAMLHDAASGAT